MKSRHAVALITFATVSLVRLASADVAPVLEHDPFRPPPIQLETRSERYEEERAEAFDVVLRSTIVRGKTSLVNLGGTILAVGDEVHGYRLIEVSPFDATFEKDGERIKLEIFREGEQVR